MTTRTLVTPRGLSKLHEQLRYYIEIERPKNVRDIEEARAHGDLRENAEYHAAKERQGMIQANIQMIESQIATAEIIDPAQQSGTRVIFGATVTLTDVENDHEVRYQIVGDAEADLAAGLISLNAPMARGLIGKDTGDEVAVYTPKGKRNFVIERVEFK
jgi:transcription elongation factor GreA